MTPAEVDIVLAHLAEAAAAQHRLEPGDSVDELPGNERRNLFASHVGSRSARSACVGGCIGDHVVGVDQRRVAHGYVPNEGGLDHDIGG
jgi:hypothetical protein